MRQPVDLDRHRGQGDVEHRPGLGVWGSRSRVGAENQCPGSRGTGNASPQTNAVYVDSEMDRQLQENAL
jgi:hypothetical protein